MMKLGKRGYQVFKKTHRWVALGGEVVEDISYFIREWTGWRWVTYKVPDRILPSCNCTKLFKSYAEARDIAERLAATARAEKVLRENGRPPGIFQEPVEEIIWV